MKSPVYKAQVTVFLSLMLMVLLGFVSSLIQLAKIHNTKANLRIYNEGAITSIFGEYNKLVKEHYGIFTLDATYEGMNYDTSNIMSRLTFYGGSGDEGYIENMQLLSQGNGAAFLDQVIYYMKDTTVTGFFDDLLRQDDEWLAVEEEDINENLAYLGQVQSDIDHQLESSVEQTETQQEEITNPLSIQEGFDIDGILNLVLDDTDQISSGAVLLSELPSKRELQTGIGQALVRESSSSLQKIYLIEYLLGHCNYATLQLSESERVETESEEQTENNKLLQYQLEYIIQEKASDKSNLKGIVNKLILVRSPINYAILQQDSVKKAEVYTLAVSLAVLTGAVGTEELVAQALMWAWAYAESIVDVKTLLAGKKLSVLKDSSDWQLSLSSVLNLGKDDLVEGAGSENGMKYEDYLRILLYLKGVDELSMLALDVIENDLRYRYAQDYFQVDHCVNRLELLITAPVGYGYTYSFPLYYSYR